ncbi:mannosyltransferase [Rhodococcus aerolatus]
MQRFPAAGPLLRRGAPLALLVSVAVRLWVTLGTRAGLDLVDLRVYSGGGAAALDGSLYSFTYAAATPDFPLPFTYPPFAALLFTPLHLLPFTPLGVAWQLATVAALWGVLRVAAELVVGRDAVRTPRWRSLLLVWTAVAVWFEPVRTTLNFGQVNVFLVLGALLAVRSRRWWLSGLLVGLLAGVKLTPAVTGAYLLLRRRFAATVTSAVVFAATVGVSILALGSEAASYFTDVGLDTDRIGPVGSAINQSLRGALSRLVGHDIGMGALWAGAVAVVLVLAALAWRRLDPDDRLGALVVVQLVGLLASPISWSHHWVWLVPALLWLVHGPLRGWRPAQVLAALWALVLLTSLVQLLLDLQPTIWQVQRPLLEAVVDAVYPVGAVALLVVLALRPRPAPDRATAVPREPAAHA